MHPSADASLHDSPDHARAPGSSPVCYGELHPVGGGDPIPLLKPTLIVGRRESSDIVLRFPNVSGTHCELSLSEGHWVVKDLGSSNGTKINGTRVGDGRLRSGDKLSVGRHEYVISYDPALIDDGAAPGMQGPVRDIFSKSLLATAGLEKRRSQKPERPGQ